MYRNYDGSRSGFGDTSVRATVANPDNVAAFAAERGADGALTIMVINKTTTARSCAVSLANFTAVTAQVWQLTSANSINHLADLPVADFYKQLAWEIDNGHILDNAEELKAA